MDDEHLGLPLVRSAARRPLRGDDHSLYHPLLMVDPGPQVRAVEYDQTRGQRHQDQPAGAGWKPAPQPPHGQTETARQEKTERDGELIESGVEEDLDQKPPDHILGLWIPVFLDRVGKA